MTDKTLLEAAKAALKWADDLKPYAEDGTQVVPVFEALREAIAGHAAVPSLSVEIKERVARALYDHEWCEPDMPDWEQNHDAQDPYRDNASAALRAIADAGFVIVPREPTEAMLAAGALAIDRAAFDSNWKGHPEDQRSRQDSAYDDARSALGAALKEMGAG